MLFNTSNNRELATVSDLYESKIVKNELGNRVKTSVLKGQKIDIDEDKLDLFDYYKGDIPDIDLDEKRIKPFNELKVFYFDIETTGGIEGKKINYHDSQISLIGVKNQFGKEIIFDCYSNERQGIRAFLKLLKDKKPDILAGYNNLFFDLPFIIGRCEVLGIPHLFYREIDKITKKPKTKVRATAQINGAPIEYNPIWLSYKDFDQIHHCCIIDLFHEVLAWDYQARKLTNYRLKTVPVQLGLIRESEVIDLPYEEQKKQYDIWDSEGKETLVKYLRSDINLTFLLGNKLIPPIYFQSKFLDWKLQSIMSSGNGAKWNSIIEKEYTNSSINIDYLPQKKHFYKGALTEAVAGIYGSRKNTLFPKEVCKLDVSSLYPSVMELYGIASCKDVDFKQLGILRSLRMKKFELSDNGDNSSENKAMIASIKILINSGYGFLGTQGVLFNDFVAAALVTAYSRGIFKLMVKSAVKFGARLASCDTDGIICEVDKGESNNLHKYIQERLPGNGTKCPITIKLEWVADAVFVPEMEDKKIENDLYSLGVFGENQGLRKNYIIVNLNNGKSIEPLKYNGKYVKRDRFELEKEFQPNIILALIKGGETDSNKYYNDIIKSLHKKAYPLDKLKITRIVRVGEKNLINQNIGVPGESVSIWKTKNTYAIGSKGQTLKKIEINGYTNTPDIDLIDWDFYIKNIEKQYKDVIKYFNN